MTLIGPADLEKNFAARAKNQGKFDAIVVGAWQAGLCAFLGGFMCAHQFKRACVELERERLQDQMG